MVTAVCANCGKILVSGVMCPKANICCPPTPAAIREAAERIADKYAIERHAAGDDIERIINELMGVNDGKTN